MRQAGFGRAVSVDMDSVYYKVLSRDDVKRCAPLLSFCFSHIYTFPDVHDCGVCNFA